MAIVTKEEAIFTHTVPLRKWKTYKEITRIDDETKAILDSIKPGEPYVLFTAFCITSKFKSLTDQAYNSVISLTFKLPVSSIEIDKLADSITTDATGQSTAKFFQDNLVVDNRLMQTPRDLFMSRAAQKFTNKDNHPVDIVIPSDIGDFIEDENLKKTLFVLREKFIKQHEELSEQLSAHYHPNLAVGRDESQDASYLKCREESDKLLQNWAVITAGFFSSFEEYTAIIKKSKKVKEIMSTIRGDFKSYGKAQAKFDAFEKNNFCGSCAKKGDNMQVCSGCKSIRYCSQKCQKTHWEHHKKICTYKSKGG